MILSIRWLVLSSLLALALPRSVQACCAVAAKGVPVVNADQTVILLWDKDRQTEHFIRKATFRSAGHDVGFIVPSPSRPQLEESGDEAFPYLARITAPKAQPSVSMPLSCAANEQTSYGRGVRVVEEKTVAGYHAVVLAADSGRELTSWLRDHGYASTPEMEAWAQPYLDARWYMTAMKIAEKDTGAGDTSRLGASALRITFKTDRPLFPYREPDSRSDASRLNISDRVLRIYFIGEARYAGHFPSGQAWGGEAKWSDVLEPGQRSQLLRQLGLPPTTGPAQFWLTEFVDHWPYGKAPGDVYFAPAASQKHLGRTAEASYWRIDPTLVVALGVILVVRKRR